MTPLDYAVRSSNVLTVKLLLASGADVQPSIKNDGNQPGNSLLMESVWQGNVEIAKLLLDNGADVNHQNVFGNTAVMYAVEGVLRDNAGVEPLESEMVKLLVSYGADLELKDGEGRSAIERIRDGRLVEETC